MRLKIAVLMMAVIAITATLGASAYTTGEVSRSSTVDVVTDADGLIALADGSSGNLVYTDGTTGELAIDVTAGTSSATGVNGDATFKLGNESAPTTKAAFSITNKDSAARDLTVTYTDSGTGTDTTGDSANVAFKVYNSTGTLIGTASEESSLTLTSVASAETHYVVVVIDTTGLGKAADLSGTLKVSA